MPSNEYMSITSLFDSIRTIQAELEANPAVISKIVNDPSKLSEKSLYNVFVTDKELRKITEKLFIDGHHARAVEEAYKLLNNLVKKRSGLINADGANLMRQSFSAKAPILKLNAGTNQSEQDEQQGYMDILAGCMTGIRNPRAHEHEWEDSEQRALQLLSMANHLIERIRNSEKLTNKNSE